MSEQSELLADAVPSHGDIDVGRPHGSRYGPCSYCQHEIIGPNVLFWYGLRYHQTCVMKRGKAFPAVRMSDGAVDGTIHLEKSFAWILSAYEAKAAGIADSRRRGITAPAVGD